MVPVSGRTGKKNRNCKISKNSQNFLQKLKNNSQNSLRIFSKFLSCDFFKEKPVNVLASYFDLLVQGTLEREAQLTEGPSFVLSRFISFFPFHVGKLEIEDSQEGPRGH